MAELIRLGAYRKNSDRCGHAIHFYPGIEEFLSQLKADKVDIGTGYERLAEVLKKPAQSAQPAGQPGRLAIKDDGDNEQPQSGRGFADGLMKVNPDGPNKSA